MTREPESQERWEVMSSTRQHAAGFPLYTTYRVVAGSRIVARNLDQADADHIVALHNASLAPQDAGEWRLVTVDGEPAWRTGHGDWTDLRITDVAGALNNFEAAVSALTTRLREAEQERVKAVREAKRERDSASMTRGMYNGYRQRMDAAEARVTALEAALRPILAVMIDDETPDDRTWYAVNDQRITVGDVRRAQALAKGEAPNE